MKTGLTAAVIFWFAATPALGHRLDEYLQGTLVSVEKTSIQAEITLTPGVAVYPIVLAEIDTNADGVISETEQRAYAGRVLHDLSATIDGRPLRLQLLSTQFPTIAEMKDGLGEIRIDFGADLPSGGGTRRLILENHHLSRIAAYQVNCLIPRDPSIRIVAQNRNYSQSFYQVGVRAGWCCFRLAVFGILAQRWRMARRGRASSVRPVRMAVAAARPRCESRQDRFQRTGIFAIATCGAALHCEKALPSGVSFSGEI